MTILSATPPSRSELSPHPLWWVLLVFATLVGGLGMAMVDGRKQSDTVPYLPWLDEVHFVGGGLALAVGVWAFRRDLLVRAPQVHRTLGWIYIAATVSSSVASLALAAFSAGGLAAHSGFLVVGCLWLASTMVGIRAIQQGELVRHRRWMVRSYTFCSAAITLRLELPILLMSTGDFEFSYTVIAWASWLPNLAFAEWWLSRTSVHGRFRRRTEGA